MELNKLTIPDFTSLVNIMWLDSMEAEKREAYNSGIWKVRQIAENSGDSRRMSEIDLEQYAERKGEADQAARARYQQGYTKDLLAYRVGKDIGITYEERTQNKYPEVIDRLSNLASLAVRTIERDLSLRLAYFSATSYTEPNGTVVDTTGGDSLAWASTSHTLRASTSTYRNILANNPVISRGSLEAMERMNIENSLNQFGEKIPGMVWDVIWTTDNPQDCNVVSEYLDSTGSPDFTNSAVKNVYQYKYRHVRLPRVALTVAGLPDTTKARRWGMCSTQWTTAFIGVWEEPHVTPFVDTNDGTDTWRTGTRAGYGICHVTGRGNSFSLGDGTP